MAFIPEGAAARSLRLRWAMGGVTALVVAVDQVSKSLVLARHPAAGTGWVTIRLVRNTGIAGGFGAGYPLLVSLVVVVITAIAAAVALRAQGRIAALFLAAVVGGALGNLADRVLRAPGWGRGAVVDWIHLGSGGGSMNVSDLAIQCGVLGALAAMAILGGRRAGQEGSSEPVRDDGLRKTRRQRTAPWPKTGQCALSRSGRSTGPPNCPPGIRTRMPRRRLAPSPRRG
jgi:signal peptidase II